MTSQPNDPLPRYEPYQAGGAAPAGYTCPKCGGSMRTVDRNGIHIEQCLNCRGVFLDFGELENITQLEARFVASPPLSRGTVTGPTGVIAAASTTGEAAWAGCSSAVEALPRLLRYQRRTQRHLWVVQSPSRRPRCPAFVVP